MMMNVDDFDCELKTYLECIHDLKFCDLNNGLILLGNAHVIINNIRLEIREPIGSHTYTPNPWRNTTTTLAQSSSPMNVEFRKVPNIIEGNFTIFEKLSKKVTYDF